MTETAADELAEMARSALLAEVRGSVLRLLAELPRLPARLKVSARDVTVELEWPAPGEQAHSAEHAGLDLPVATTGAAPPAGHRLTAPTVGTFYCAPEPGAQPFVEVGDAIRPGQQVAILETMKLMLPVEADLGGIVIEVLKRDGEFVEFGEPLLVIEPVERG
jgi:acetyl-CoA carboxylase biotin carboxyl carrier protein